MLDIQDVTINNYVNAPFHVNLFWNQIETYTDVITKKDIREWLEIMVYLPPVLLLHVSMQLTKVMHVIQDSPQASDRFKKNSKLFTEILQIPILAKVIFENM